MRIEMLIVGWFTAPGGFFRAGDDLERIVRFPIPAYLIETDTERILVDTGLNPAAIEDPATYYERPDIFAVFGLEQERSVAEQVDVNTLTKVILTHLHWDHVGGLGLIPPSAPLFVQRAEWEAGHDRAGIERNVFLPRDFAGQGRQLILVDGDHDLLGDGSIELLHTPGHTPGHQSVRAGDIVIGADVVHYASGLDDHRFPVFAHDHELQKRSAERLRALRDAGARVLPGHDPELIVGGILSAS